MSKKRSSEDKDPIPLKAYQRIINGTKVVVHAESLEAAEVLFSELVNKEDE